MEAQEFFELIRCADIPGLLAEGLKVETEHDRIQLLGSLEFMRLIDYRKFTAVADIGAGPGHQSFLFQRLGLEVAAIDFRAPEYSGVRHVKPNEISAESAKYDLLWSHHCLEHIRDPIGALIEWGSLLKPGGYFCLTVPEVSMAMSSGHINSYSIPLLMYHLAIAGFNVREKSFSKQRSHLRAYVRKDSNYDPKERVVTDLRELARLGLFSPSVSKAIDVRGRFDASDVHLNWFGRNRAPALHGLAAHAFVLDNIWIES
jgi:SAM-dependent methyltransferase